MESRDDSHENQRDDRPPPHRRAYYPYRARTDRRVATVINSSWRESVIR